MKYAWVAALCFLLVVAGCAGNRVAGDNSGNGEYVEVSNPAYTLTPNAPPTIWVKRESVQKGPPRGGDVIKKGYDAVVNEIKGGPHQGSPAPPPSVPEDDPKEQTRENQFR